MLYTEKTEKLLIQHFLSLECKRNQSFAEYTTMKVGGTIEFMLFLSCITEIIDLLRIFAHQNIPYFILGKGSNLIVNDEGLKLVTINTKKLNKITLDEQDPTVIIAETGAFLEDLSEFALQHSLTGLEFVCGIPGTVGGAVFMNAGAYGGEIKDILLSSYIFDPHKGPRIFDNKAHDFSYRYSFLSKSNNTLLTSSFQLQKGEQKTIHAKMSDFVEQRSSKQPLDIPNAGSIFKRPEGYFTGKLIADAGLQGVIIGGASVSTKHAGFIVNSNNATAQDILDLIAFIQKTVFEKFNVHLEPEVRFLEKNGTFRKLS